ncbi:MAG: hypothetical protein HY288_18320 [Planctomycetia bacterium]|nr:hypothetical protein [Planctomycetia bacterium]
MQNENMETHVKPSPERLEPAIESLLARLRRRIRAYVWADGVAAALVLVGVSFWFSLALDWFFELPRLLRVVELIGLGAAVVYILFRFLLERLFVRLADHNMAVLLERRFGQLRDSLLTTVELAEHPDHGAGFNREMLAHTHRDAVARTAQIDLNQVFDTAPLVRRMSLAAALVASVLVFAVAASDALGTWARRSLLVSDESWPRKVHLAVQGFDRGGHLKIARGSDWELIVKADAAPGREVPEVVQVRYRTLDGAQGRENMSREGVVAPRQGAFQNYAHTFKGVLAPLEFYVLGGDDRQGPMYLDVVDSPTISRMTLHCEYPRYMRREPRDVAVAGLVQLPRGTQITLQAEANKPLVSVRIDDLADENTPITHQLDLAAEHGAPQSKFQFSLARLDGDKTLLFTLLDADGIKSHEAVRLALGAVPDEPPQVNVQLKGISAAITSNARLPAGGEISDDYGVMKIWFEYQVDDAPPRQQAFTTPVDGEEKLAVADVLEVRDLQLQPKQKLHWAVQAADGFALDAGPNVGSSQQYVLDVVTSEQLRSMLEARELMLRRRFETIVEELTETRNLLSGVTLGPKDEPAKEPSKQGGATPAPGREPGDAAEEAAENPRPGTAPLSLQVERVLQNCQRSSHETLQVALAFDAIREEMENNRVDTEELKTRLKDGVADPLKRIVEQMFPPLEERLKKLAGQLSDLQAGPATQAAALSDADAILVEMRQVLDKMLELETFNEVLDILRGIISTQEKVNAETKQKQRQKVRDLTE